MNNLVVVSKEQNLSKGKGNKPFNFVKCPRCGKETMFNGFHPATGLQKYKCKEPNCRRQFIPGLPQRTNRGFKENHCPQVLLEQDGLFKGYSKFSPSHDSVGRWTKKSAISFHKNLGPLEIPKSDTLHFDETGCKERGKKTWLWLGMEDTFNSIQGYHLSYQRATEYVRKEVGLFQRPFKKVQRF